MSLAMRSIPASLRMALCTNRRAPACSSSARRLHNIRAASSATSSPARVIPPRPAAAAPAAAPSRPAPSTPSPAKSAPPLHDLTTGLQDPLPNAPTTTTTTTSSNNGPEPVDWSRSFHGLSTVAFEREASAILMEPILPADVEVKPDGIIYLPEIKYRRILNRAFGPGAWGLAPRGETIVTPKSVTREYGLVVQGRLVSIARGEQQYFDPEGIPTATEGCKSNALMRCCKDLGIASELWDPVFIREFMSKHAKEVWVEHNTTKRKKKIHMRKDVQNIPYPFVLAKAT